MNEQSSLAMPNIFNIGYKVLICKFTLAQGYCEKPTVVP